MNIQKSLSSAILAAGFLFLAGPAQLQAQTSNLVIAAFASGAPGVLNPGGGQYGGDSLSDPYGAGTIAWSGPGGTFPYDIYESAAGYTGAAYLNTVFNNSQNNWLLASMGPGYNNWYY